MRLVDNHIHSYFSEDSRMGIDDAILTAKAKGLAGIVFSDHIDFDPPAGEVGFTFDVPAQQKAVDLSCRYLSVQVSHDSRISQASQVAQASKNFLMPQSLCSDDSFRVMKGVEIGLQAKSMDKIRKVMSNNKFDTVIASLPLIDGYDPYYGGYYRNLDYRTAYGHYLEEFYNGIRTFGDFDILGHFDYIVRYASYRQTTIYYSEFGDILHAILKFLVENGKTFEINTKTYQSYRNRRPELDIDILRQFKELGGEAVSFGSDAHNILRIGDKFDWCRECALEAGIRYEVFFVERKPNYIAL